MRVEILQLVHEISSFSEVLYNFFFLYQNIYITVTNKYKLMNLRFKK